MELHAAAARAPPVLLRSALRTRSSVKREERVRCDLSAIRTPRPWSVPAGTEEISSSRNDINTVDFGSELLDHFWCARASLVNERLISCRQTRGAARCATKA